MFLSVLSFFAVPADDGYGGIIYHLTPLGYAAILLLMLALILIPAALFARRSRGVRFETKQLVFCSAAVALSVVTSFIKVYTFPFGGSITLCSMLFVCLIGYWYGPRISLTTGLAYGLLQLVTGPYIVFPLQVLVDYPLAFGALGLSGFFWNSKHGLIKGYLVGVLGRYMFAVLSGWLFFGAYAWEGWAPLPYSLAYNAAYLVPEAVVTLMLLFLPPVKKAMDQVKQFA
ncbi:MAG: energy-coupled thiamine transporter ThiT [Lachnospiraceae bacterium]|jgi:thiamine transporter|nr:energy-coupled thiamine transporter ThiT [Lachnospiraceae bacterium]